MIPLPTMTKNNIKGLVYYCYNKLTDKIYIGYTTGTLKRRISGHYCTAKHDKTNNYFHSSLVKYPKEELEWGILYQSNVVESLKDVEKYYIALFNSNNRTLGYNLTTGGDLCKFNMEVNLAISKKAIERDISGDRNPFYNKRHTEETKKHLSEVRKGVCNNLGYKHTDETKKLLSAKRIELCKDMTNIHIMRRAQKSKPIKCLNNGNIYYSAGEAAALLNISKGGIKAQLSGRLSKYKGYEFIFI